MSFGVDFKLTDYSNNIFLKNKIKKTQLNKSLQEGNGQIAQAIIDSMSKDHTEFTQEELWQLKVFKNLDFKDQEFLSLTLEIQKLIYRTANNFNNISLVTRLNSLSRYTLDDYIKKPGILSQFMDIASVNQIISELLTKLRRDDKLLTVKELQDLKLNCSWRIKKDFTRILGCYHLSHLIKELNLKYVKVPEKKAVIKPDCSTLSFRVGNQDDLIYILSDNVDIYAQEIEQVERLLSREEINELFLIIEMSNYNDFYYLNFIISNDGIYFIDTEFKSFSESIIWDNLYKLKCFVADEDQEWFIQHIAKKLSEQKSIEEEPSLPFHSARFLARRAKKNPEKVETGRAVEYKRIVEQCKLVGSHKERVFSFPVQDILLTRELYQMREKNS